MLVAQPLLAVLDADRAKVISKSLNHVPELSIPSGPMYARRILRPPRQFHVAAALCRCFVFRFC